VAQDSSTPTRSGDDFESQLRRPLRRFIHNEAGSAGLLVAVSLFALLWANSPWSEEYFDLWHTPVSVLFDGKGVAMDLHGWVNDGLMVVFFFVVGLEVRREFSVGELTDRTRVSVPLIAGIGGMIAPALIYLAINPSGPANAGWGVVIGTDTAFLLGMLALVGPAVSTQLRIFLLTLTVIDDIVAVSVIGIVYSDAIEPVPLAVAGGCLVLLAVLARLGEWRASPYVAVVVVLWVATLQSGVHAAIAGMLSGLLVPALDPERRQVEAAAVMVNAFRQSPMPEVQRTARTELNRAISVNERLQEVLHAWTTFVIVPIFALANAGVDLRDGVLADALQSRVTWGVVAGLAVGKLLGIGFGALGAVRLGAGRLPQGVGPGHVLSGAALSGIGFTVSLLIVSLAFADEERIRNEATVGVLIAAVVASALGWLLFRVAAKRGEGDAALPVLLSDPIDPEVDHVYGPPDAELTLIEYLDYECPFCARATGAAEQVKRHFGTRLRYVVRHLPLLVHPHAELAGLAAEAAARQGKFWEMHATLFAHQDRLELDDLTGYAEELGLDVEQFLEDLEDDALMERLRRDVASAELSGVRGTPTFFVGDHRHIGPFDATTLIQALEDSVR